MPRDEVIFIAIEITEFELRDITRNCQQSRHERPNGFAGCGNRYALLENATSRPATTKSREPLPSIADLELTRLAREVDGLRPHEFEVQDFEYDTDRPGQHQNAR